MDGEKILSKQDFLNWPIWKLDDRDDTYCKILSLSDIPYRVADMRIKTKFYTPQNIEIDGYLIGFNRIFCVALFMNQKTYKFNYNLPGFADRNIDELILNEIIKNENDLFPLKYKTDLDKANMKNFIGTFDVFDKESCKNEHSDKEIY